MPLTGSAFANILATISKDLDLAPLSSALTAKGKNGVIFTDGIAVNQINELFHDERTLANGVSEELDLSGVLANPLGDIVNFVGVKVIGIYSANANNLANLEVGGAAANTSVFLKDATDIVTVGPALGSSFLLINPSAAGFPVVGGASDKLKITHDGSNPADFVYRIVLLGIK